MRSPSILRRRNTAFLNNGDTLHASSALATFNVFNTVYYGGIALSASLFVWMVFEIINYVTISNGTAG